MEALLVISSAALAYHITNQRRLVGSNDRDAPFRNSDFQPDESLQGPKLQTFGHTKPRGPSVNIIHDDIVDNYRSETPIGTVNFRAAGFRPMWTEQDKPPLQERQERVLKFDEGTQNIDAHAESMRVMAGHVTQHLASNRRIHDGVLPEQERVAPPVRGGLSQNAPTLQPRHHSFALGEDLTGQVLDGNVSGGQQVSGGRSQLFRTETHEVRPDRALDMHGVSAPKGLRPSGSIRGSNATLGGTALPTLEWDYGATGNRASVLSSGAQVRDRFVEPTRGMDLDSDAPLKGSAAGTQHRQGGSMRSRFTYGLRQLLDLPTPAPAPDRVDTVSTTRPKPAADIQQNRIELPTVDASHRKNATRFASSTTGPRSASTPSARMIPDLPPPLVNYGSHPVDQSSSQPAPAAQVTNLVVDVDTTRASQNAALRPFEFRENRNIAGTTAVLQDELPVTGLLMPFDVTRRRAGGPTVVPSEGTQREPGEFLRR